MAEKNQPTIGIALGGGAARGWSHIGILRALETIGVAPDIVCGTSIGALVGAAYASSRLDALEEWIVGLDFWDMLRLLDVKFGGLVEGERVMKAFIERVQDVPIESLPKRFGAVATDLDSGREVWFQSGSLALAVRASISLPGLFNPVRRGDRWLVDGGLVDPVPVSLCRAMGARWVIAVNLSGDLLGRQYLRRSRIPKTGDLLGQLGNRLQAALGNQEKKPWSPRRESEDETPSLFDVMAGAMNIMQDRIIRSRLAGDPPDVVLAPRVGHLALMDFHRAEEAIAAGRNCVEIYEPVIRHALNLDEAGPEPAD